uniref:Uncharacterized protein n=1 Tax=Oryza rufipogon TaxID=4529 RepID=A0A0E0PRZ6_ORYRU
MPNVQVADVSNLTAGITVYKKDKMNCMLDAYVFNKSFKPWSLRVHSSLPSETQQEPEARHRHHHSSLGPLQPPQALSAPPQSAARFLVGLGTFLPCLPLFQFDATVNVLNNKNGPAGHSD